MAVVLCLLSCILVGLSTWSAAAGGVPTYPTRLGPCSRRFGTFVEGAAVDRYGSFYAVNYGGAGDRNTLGRVALAASPVTCSRAATVPASPVSRQPGAQKYPSQFNGARFLRDGSVLLTDLGDGHRVIKLSKKGKATTWCHDARMVQPNDLAISRRGHVYVSGQNWADNNVAGDGQLWLCRPRRGGASATAIAINLRLGRTNGIELSPDEKWLYVSEAWNKNGAPIKNAIWRYRVLARGLLGRRKLFFDFAKDKSANVDVDGMRTDVKGVLYVTRNAGGQVVALSPRGRLLRRYLLPFDGATNLEMAGRDGKTLVVVGRCGRGTLYGAGTGCTATVRVPHPGRAWAGLQKH